MTGLLRTLAGHPPAKFCVLANALRDTRRGKAKTRNRRASLLLEIPVMDPPQIANGGQSKLGPGRAATLSVVFARSFPARRQP